MERLLEILEELHDDVDYKTCTNLVDGKVFDSFDIVALIADISDEFDVDIPAEEIVPENFNSAEEIYNLIQRLVDQD